MVETCGLLQDGLLEQAAAGMSGGLVDLVVLIEALPAAVEVACRQPSVVLLVLAVAGVSKAPLVDTSFAHQVAKHWAGMSALP